MPFRLKLCFVLLSLLVSPTSRVLACGSGLAEKCGQSDTEKSCCAPNSDKKQAHCCDNPSEPEQDPLAHRCPKNSDCNDCNCPCGTIFSGLSTPLIAAQGPAFPLISGISIATSKLAFYFNQHMPEAVYLSIWQPPKLGA